MTRPINDPDLGPIPGRINDTTDADAGSGARRAPAPAPAPPGWEGQDLYLLLTYGPAPGAEDKLGPLLLGPVQAPGLPALRGLAEALRYFSARHCDGQAIYCVGGFPSRPELGQIRTDPAELGPGWTAARPAPGDDGWHLLFARTACLESIGPLSKADLDLLQSALHFALETEDFGLLLDAHILGPKSAGFEVDVLDPEDADADDLEPWLAHLQPGRDGGADRF